MKPRLHKVEEALKKARDVLYAELREHKPSTESFSRIADADIHVFSALQELSVSDSRNRKRRRGGGPLRGWCPCCGEATDWLILDDTLFVSPDTPSFECASCNLTFVIRALTEEDE